MKKNYFFLTNRQDAEIAKKRKREFDESLINAL